MRWLSHKVMMALGWRIEGGLPDVPKMVLVGAPHTSNWDFFLFLAAIHHFDIRVRFLGKATLFRWPFGFMFRKVGGIPVVRSRAVGVVRQVNDYFDKEERMILVVAPEGTRSAAPKWRSGFVEIAEAAGVPVVLAGVDGPNKTLTFGPPLMVGPDRSQFMDQVRSFYEDKPGLRPEGKGPVRLSREKPAS